MGIPKARAARRPVIAWIAARMIQLSLQGASDRLLRLASFLMRQNDLTTADLAALAGSGAQAVAAMAEAVSRGEPLDEYLQRLLCVLHRYERFTSAGLASKAHTLIGE